MRFATGESPPLPPGFAVWFNGERCKPFTVVEAAEEAGLLVKIGWDTDGHVVADAQSDEIEV